MTDSVITAADREEIQRTLSPILAAARDCIVTTPQLYTQAADYLQRIKGAQKKLASKKVLLLGPAKAVVKALNDFFAGPELELAEAESLFKRGMLAYDQEQDRLRQEEQRKLDALAAKERLKREAEARANDEKARLEREAGNVRKAEALEAKANAAAVAAATIVPAIAQRDAPQVAGIVSRETWSALVLDKKVLIAAVAEGQVPEAALIPDSVFLNKMARALKKELNYPGVRAVVEKGLAAGSK